MVDNEACYLLSEESALQWTCSWRFMEELYIYTEQYLSRCGQLLYVHPFTPHHFLVTWMEVKGEGVEPTDEVQI